MEKSFLSKFCVSMKTNFRKKIAKKFKIFFVDLKNGKKNYCKRFYFYI